MREVSPELAGLLKRKLSEEGCSHLLESESYVLSRRSLNLGGMGTWL